MFVWQPIFFDRCHPCEKDEKKEVKDNVTEKLFGRLGIALLGLKLKFNPRSIWVIVKSWLPTSLCMSVCLSIRPSAACPFVRSPLSMSIRLFVPSVRLSVFPSVCPSICLPICLSFCMSIYISFRLSICLSVHLSIYPHPFFTENHHMFVHQFVCLPVRLSIDIT